MKNIVVNVLGSAGAGKTTIAKIINDALIANGFVVETKFLDGHTVNDLVLNGDEFKSRMETVKSHTNVLVNEVQLARSFGA